MGDSRRDERFTHISKDPRFRPVPKHERKVKIDKRFTSMFHDKKFKLTKYPTDKRGLPNQSSISDNLMKFYNVSSGSDEDHVENDETSSEGDQPNSLSIEVQSESESEVKAIDLARGEGNIETSSSDDSDEEIDLGGDRNVYHEWGELDNDAPKGDDISRRLAVCNMDWDRIKAEDLFVLFSSFKPAEGIIQSVKVYPSEYGFERLKEEREHGPLELVQDKLESDQEDYAETSEGSKYHMEKLRKYQLNRLRYYYAIVICDTKETSEILYNELEGMEYESSAAQIDLRFVPDDMTFEHDPISTCDALPDMSRYKPVIFTTTALQQGKVNLTWDETNPDRSEKIISAFNGGDEENDLRSFLASSSSEGENDNVVEDEEKKGNVKVNEKQQISKYKALLAEIEDQEHKKEDKFDMEIKWEPGLKTKTEELVKRQHKKILTPFEEFLDKKKEKKKLKQCKLEEPALEVMTGDHQVENEQQQPFSDDELPEDVDLNDPFFQDCSIAINATTAESGKKKKKQKHRANFINLGEDSEKSKAELELLLMGEEDKKHFNLKHLVEDSKLTKSKRKRLKRKHIGKEVKKEDDFKINVSDPRFSALFTSPLYNLDPSDSHYKETEGTKALVLEKQKRRTTKSADENKQSIKLKFEDKIKENPSLTFLVNSVKKKTQNYRNKKT